MIASVQPHHAPSDRDIVDKYWGKREGFRYPYKSLLNHPTKLVFGSDVPIETMDALRIISRREKVKAKIPLVPIFYNLNLLSLKFVGCTYELGVAGYMRLRSGKLFKDMPLAKEFIKKRKLNFFPSFKNIFKINKVIRKVKKIENSK